MNKWPFCSPAVFAFFIILPTISIATPEPSFECAKATAAIEKLICSDDGLAQQDKELAEKVSDMQRLLNGKRGDDFLKGQRIWLKLREEACILDTDEISQSDKISCIHSVYEERLKEIRQQKESYSKGNQADFDSALDEEVDLTAGEPEDISAMKYLSHGDDIDRSRLPHTCRELYTLLAGGWTYGADNIGVYSSSNADTICRNKIHSHQSTNINNPS